MRFKLCSSLICLLAFSYGGVDCLLADELWKETADLQQASLTTAFIKGVASASLDPTAFGGYVVRDSIYCYKVKLNIDLALNRTTDESLRQLLVFASKGYEGAYKELFKEWYVQNPEGISIGNALAGYINHIHNVTLTMNPYYLVVTLIPSAKLWPWIGAQIKSTTGNFGVYSKWVKEDLDSTNRDYIKYEKIINDAFNAGKIDKKTALFLYKRSMMDEVAFFNDI